MKRVLHKYKKDVSYSYTLGVFPTLELLKQKPSIVENVFCTSTSDKNKGVNQIKKLCKKHNIHFEVNDRIIQKVTSKENIYALGVFKKYSSKLISNKNHLVLVNPSNAGNLGTIIRTALGFGIKNIALIKPAVDIFMPEVIRSSMGSLFKINFQYFESFKAYKKTTDNTFYLFFSDGDTLLNKTTFMKPFSLIFGNESSGLPQEFKKLGKSVRIPQRRDIDSYNLAVSVGIALYEIKNQSIED